MMVNNVNTNNFTTTTTRINKELYAHDIFCHHYLSYGWTLSIILYYCVTYKASYTQKKISKKTKYTGEINRET